MKLILAAKQLHLAVRINMIQRLYNEAEIIGNDKTALEKRLRDGKDVLYSCYKAYFLRGKFDFQAKRLIGSNGFYLQWENDGETNRGSVYLYKS